MGKIQADNLVTLSENDIKQMNEFRKKELISDGEKIINSSAVTITNLPEGASKKYAALIVASKKVLEYISGGGDINNAEWEVKGQTSVKALKFSAPEACTLALENIGGNTPSLQYSTSKETWTDWDYSNLSFGGSNKDLYI